MYNYNEKYFTNYVEKVKDVECEEESKDASYSGQTMKALIKVK